MAWGVVNDTASLSEARSLESPGWGESLRLNLLGCPGGLSLPILPEAVFLLARPDCWSSEEYFLVTTSVTLVHLRTRFGDRFLEGG